MNSKDISKPEFYLSSNDQSISDSTSNINYNDNSDSVNNRNTRWIYKIKSLIFSNSKSDYFFFNIPYIFYFV
jgi:hypothetical protein